MKRLICYFFLCSVFVFSLVYFPLESQEVKEYSALFGDHSKVYDGDTLKDIYVVIHKFEGLSDKGSVLFPGIYLKKDTLYVVTDLRIFGIDTPEMKPRKAGRTEVSRMKEKKAAAEARQALVELFEAHDFEFVVRNVQYGKYAGRVVSEVLVGSDRINAADYLLQRGYALPYDGGTKPTAADWGF